MNPKRRVSLENLPSMEATPDLARAVANHPGLVVLMQHGKPIGAAVDLDELLFILDARAAEDEDTLSGLEEPSSGEHHAARRKDH